MFQDDARVSDLDRISLKDATVVSSNAAPFNEQQLANSLLSPGGLTATAREVRKHNGGQRGVNNLLDGHYLSLKELGENISPALAEQYASAYEALGSGQFDGHAAKIRSFGKAAEQSQVTYQQALEWKSGWDTGLSSQAMWTHFMNRPDEQTGDYPHDMDDFGRCVRLIEAVPAWRERIPELAVVSDRWSAIAENWDALEAAYRGEVDSRAARQLLRDVMTSTVDQGFASYSLRTGSPDRDKLDQSTEQDSQTAVIRAFGDASRESQKTYQKALDWKRGNDTGLSSEAMWNHFMNRHDEQTRNYPHDMSDFGRCVRLIEAVPEWRERIPELAVISDRWSAIAENWDMLEEAYRESEYGVGTQLLRDVMSSKVGERGLAFA